MAKKLFPWILGLIWLAVRWVLYITIGKTDPDLARNVGVMLNLFFIIITIFNVLLSHYRKRAYSYELTFMDQFKSVMKDAMKYSISFGVCLAVFYNLVSNELEMKRESDYKAIELALDSDEKVNAIKAENIRLKDFSKDQIIQAAKERTALFTNEKIVSSASFLVTVFVSLIYSLFSVLLYRYLIKSRASAR